MRTAMAALVVACCLPRTAHAGRSFYGWLYGTEVLPERGVELQTWIVEENDKYGSATQADVAVVGTADRRHRSARARAAARDSTWTTSDSHRDAVVHVPAVRHRGALPPGVAGSGRGARVRRRWCGSRSSATSRCATTCGSKPTSWCRTRPARSTRSVDVGFIGDVTSGSTRTCEIRPGAAAQRAGRRRAPARRRGVLRAQPRQRRARAGQLVGPNLAWTHGRFWLSGAFGIGVYHVRIAPRVMWGIAF